MYYWSFIECKSTRSFCYMGIVFKLSIGVSFSLSAVPRLVVLTTIDLPLAFKL